MREDYGTQLEDGSMRFVRDLPGPIERVWEYLVDPDKRALWFCGGTMADDPGSAFTLAFRNADLNHESGGDNCAADDKPIDIEAVLVEIDTPRLLIFRWTDVETRFELEEQGDRVQLVLIQPPPDDLAERVGMAAGWHSHIGLLVDILAGEPPRSLSPEYDAAEPHYKAVVR